MRSWSVLAVLGAAAVLAGCGAGGDRPADSAADASVEPGAGGFHGTQVPASMPAPALSLVEAGGRRFDLAGERGKAVLVFFGYTHCPDICPTTLSTWRRVKQGLGEDTSRVRFVFVSVDPERDTPEVARSYAHQFDPSFVGLSGTRAQIDSVQRAFHITSFREQPVAGDSAAGDSASGHGAHAGHDASSGYAVSHPARVFIFDPSGRWRLILPASATAEATLSDVRRLLD
ncbi:MAG TPA: SCO family protein [Gemmatimonadaceae bacterium]|nr:SCO family protein [Gemmatimonadaceae bacterium]